MSEPLLQLTEAGIYCVPGGFYIDPWRAVPRAVLTHAHADHARSGSDRYLVCEQGAPLFRARLGADASIETARYGERVQLGEVTVWLAPAGHVLGSAQIVVEERGRRWVVSGDYKLAPDPTCEPFSPVRCDVFLTESTFGLPVFRWRTPEAVIGEITEWWRENQAARRTSVLFVYSLGKAQRVLCGLPAGIGPVVCHGAIARINGAYRDAGAPVPEALPVDELPAGAARRDALVLAPPSAAGALWLRRFEPVSTAFASGWMAIRGMRRRRNVDRGFVLSDHADWPALNAAIAATEADEIWVTHGYRSELTRWLQANGRRARAIGARPEGDADGALGDNPGSEPLPCGSGSSTGGLDKGDGQPA